MYYNDMFSTSKLTTDRKHDQNEGPMPHLVQLGRDILFSYVKTIGV